MDDTSTAPNASGGGYPLVEVRQPKSSTLILAVRDPVEVGRDCGGLLLSDHEVSRRHLVLRADGEDLLVEDLGSTNGTTVNGSKIEGPVKLTDADVVCLGRTELRRLADMAPARPARKPMPIGGAGSGQRVKTVAVGGAAGGAAVVRGKADTSGARMTSIDAVADAVDEERGKVAKLAAAGGTVTIVFSDIESSTEMAMKLGDTRWFEVLGEHNEIIRHNIERHHGTVIKSQGDGFMLTFPSARGAMLCMIDVQRDLAKRAVESLDAPIRIRIGMHTGEAIVDSEGDLFGKHIIMAARIANLADGGQILVSAITKEITSSRGDLQFGGSQEVTLKGIEGAYEVHEVLWDESDDTEVSTPAS